MRLTAILLTTLSLLAGACSSDNDPPPSPTANAGGASAASTASPGAGSTAEAGDDEDLVEWNVDVAEQLTALEAANEGGQWTATTALDAVELVRPALLAGTTAPAPVDLNSLTMFLLEHFDEVDHERWDALVAVPAGSPAQLVAYQPSPVRDVFQDIAERTDAEFQTRTGHRLNVPIYVALSDVEKPYDLSAATFVSTDYVEGFRFLFGEEDAWQQMADDVADIAATSGEVCVIVLGQAMTRWDENRQLSAVMHEVTHCHQFQVHPQGRVGFNASKVPWMDEGYAVWAGEAFTGGTLVSRPFWNQYLGGGIGSGPDGFLLFEGDYRAHGFYSRLADAGVNPWAEFVPWFNGLRANHVSNIERYRGMTATANQEVLAGWTASSSRNDDLGAPWNSDHGPGINLARSARRASGARVSAERTFTANPGEQRYHALEVSTPADGPSLITLSAEGLATYRWEHADWNDQFVNTDTLELSWCVGEDCTCEDGSSPAPGAILAPIAAGQRPTLHAALFGGAGGAHLDIRVESLEDACEEPTPTPAASGPLDSCLFGIWNPDPQQFQDLVLRLYRQIPAITGITLVGTIDLTFDDDGTFFHTYSGVEGTGTVDGITYTATWSGGTFGTWEASGGVMALTFTGSDIVVTLSPVPIPVASPPIPTATVETSYNCGPTALEIVPPPTPLDLWPIPSDWTKVGDVAPLR
ncbi:MAG: hypothetical protein R3C39_12695 [Dehalococcoidia bacterium]